MILTLCEINFNSTYIPRAYAFLVKDKNTRSVVCNNIKELIFNLCVIDFYSDYSIDREILEIAIDIPNESHHISESERLKIEKFIIESAPEEFI